MFIVKNMIVGEVIKCADMDDAYMTAREIVHEYLLDECVYLNMEKIENGYVVNFY